MTAKVWYPDYLVEDIIPAVVCDPNAEGDMKVKVECNQCIRESHGSGMRVRAGF